MQAASDIMLGWERIVTIDGQTKDFYVRQLWDAKGSAEVELMEPAALETYGKICAWTLARAHARSGDAIAISSYLGRGEVFDRAMARSPRHMRTRTSGTTKRCSMRSRPAASLPSWTFDRVRLGDVVAVNGQPPIVDEQAIIVFLRQLDRALAAASRGDEQRGVWRQESAGRPGASGSGPTLSGPSAPWAAAAPPASPWPRRMNAKPTAIAAPRMGPTT